MAVNKYFNHFRNKREQSLFDDLMNEVIKLNGINVIYIPRSGPVNLIYGEDPLAKFDRWFEMAAYVKDTAGFQGKATLQKWGITMEQTITIQIGKTEFAESIGKDLNPNRPREGDLILFPYGLPGQYLLEVKYVNDNVPFVELGQDYVYEIDCRMFTYSNEDLNTGLPEVDSIARTIQQEIEIGLGTGTGTFAKGEVVFQGASFASSTFKAILKEIDGTTLHVSNMYGELNPTAPIVGNTSSASFAISTGDQQDIQNDRQAQNTVIQTAADPTIIKNTRNPFDKGRI